MSFLFCGCVVPSFPSAWASFGWNGSFSRVAYRKSGEREGPYPDGAVVYPRLTRLHLLAARALRKFAQSSGRDVLGAFAVKLFAKKMGPFLGGETPRSSPEGDLVFGEKAESPLTLFKRKFTSVQPTGASDMCKKSWKSFLRVEAT
jgi:hypothetical protein